MIIKHVVNLETVLDEQSSEPSVKALLSMSDTEREEFLTMAATSLVSTFLIEANEGMSWAELRVAK